MVIDRLAADFEVEVSGQPSLQPDLSNLLLGDAQTEWAANSIYLIDSGSSLTVPASDIDSTLIVIGEDAEELAARFSTVVRIAPGPTLVQLHNWVQEVFAGYNRWEADIHRVLSMGSDVQNIIAISSKVFDNPLLLIDINYKIIAFTEEAVAAPEFEPLFDPMNLPYLMSHDEVPDLGVKGVADIIPLLVNGMHAISTSLAQHKYRLLLIGRNRSLNLTDALLLRHLSSLIGLAIGFIPEYAPNRFSPSLPLKSFMDDPTMAKELLQEELLRLRWLPEHQYYCLKFHAEILDRKDRSLRFICERVASVLGEDCAFEYQDSVAAFINFTHYQGDEQALERALREFLTDNFIKVGVSNRFSGFEDLRHYYVQAELALNMGIKLQPLDDYFVFRDMVKPQLLEWCTSKLPAHMVCAQEIITLRSYDLEHGSELGRTLHQLLKNNLNYSQTARDLFIHRSTLGYRLNRIQQLVGIDFDDIDSQWFLLLSFELLKKG